MKNKLKTRSLNLTINRSEKLNVCYNYDFIELLQYIKTLNLIYSRKFISIHQLEPENRMLMTFSQYSRSIQIGNIYRIYIYKELFRIK